LENNIAIVFRCAGVGGNPGAPGDDEAKKATKDRVQVL
jgi:hypothetical protein